MQPTQRCRLRWPSRGNIVWSWPGNPTCNRLLANGGFDLVIPPLTRSTVELSVPADRTDLDLPSARGTSSPRASAIGDGAFWTNRPIGGALAGGCRRRRRCSESRSRRTILGEHPSRFFGDRYSAEISRARRPHAADPPVGDPRLRLLPTAGHESLIAEAHTLPGEPQVIDLELARPISDQVTLELRFLLTGTSGVGNLRLPRLEVDVRCGPSVAGWPFRSIRPCSSKISRRPIPSRWQCPILRPLGGPAKPDRISPLASHAENCRW